MAKRPSNNIFFPFHTGIVLLSAAEYPGDVAADGRLFSNDKMLHLKFSVSIDVFKFCYPNCNLWNIESQRKKC